MFDYLPLKWNENSRLTKTYIGLVLSVFSLAFLFPGLMSKWAGPNPIRFGLGDENKVEVNQ